MKRMILFVIAILVMAIPALASDEDTVAVSQLSIAADHGFWGEEINGLSGYASAISARL